MCFCDNDGHDDDDDDADECDDIDGNDENEGGWNNNVFFAPVVGSSSNRRTHGDALLVSRTMRYRVNRH